jgi:hypothetical protein
LVTTLQWLQTNSLHWQVSEQSGQYRLPQEWHVNECSGQVYALQLEQVNSLVFGILFAQTSQDILGSLDSSKNREGSPLSSL